MDETKIKQFLKTIWQKCDAKNSSFESNHCEKYVTVQIVFMQKTKRKLNTSSIIKGLDIAYEDNTPIIEGAYCKNCVENKMKFLRGVHYDQVLEIRDIPGAKEGLKVIV